MGRKKRLPQWGRTSEAEGKSRHVLVSRVISGSPSHPPINCSGLDSKEETYQVH